MNDVVIIGGGIIGTATAYFLSKEGRKVKVIERDPTYKTASFPLSLGGFRRQFFQTENILLGKFAREFIFQIPELLKTKKNPKPTASMVTNGYLLMFGPEHAEEQYKALENHKACDAGTKNIKGSELENFFPYINSEGKEIIAGDNTYSDITIFSFHPVKHIACGEGGMITTNSEEIYKKLLLARSHGVTKENMTTLSESDGDWYYEMQDLGYNYRITDIQCALGISQLSRARKGILNRQRIAQFYNESLAGLPIELPKVEKNKNHAYHLYVIKTNKRKALYNFLRSKEIYTQIHYIPICNQPFYKKSSLVTQEEFPIANEYYSKCLSLPMYPSIKEEELIKVVDSIKEFFQK